MIKKELLCMRRLRATPKMITVAKNDVPKKVTFNTYWGPREETRREYQLYLRCRVEGDILKVALYYPDNLRAGGRLPSYEVFIDRTAQRFITYDCINGKWLTAKLDRLDWPHYVPEYPRTWMPASEAKAAADYLSSEKLGYEAVFQYQLKIRRDKLERRHQKETASWDAEMALTPSLPKDWDRWVDKVGIPQQFMFYQYQKRGARTGYCTYCEKDVPLHSKPRHNQKVRCPCCRHEVTCKSVGKLGWHLDTDEVCVYLIQPWPDGFVVREFWAGKRYLKEDLKSPTIYCTERWRTIYDTNLVRHTYYWGTYKQFTTRWIAGIPSYSWMGANCIFNTHGDKPGRVYGKTLPHLKAVLQRTGLLEWIYGHRMTANPDAYFSIRARVPQFEQIWKAGLVQLADECTHDPDRIRRLMKESQSTDLTKALGLDKPLLKRLRQNNGGASFLRWLQFEKQSGKQISDEVLNWFCEHQISKTDLDFIWDKMNAIQIYNYLRRQIAESQEDTQQVLTTWRDYLSMADRLGIDTSDEIIYRVKLLRQRHDELLLRCQQKDREQQAVEVLKGFPDVDRIFQSIKDKYEYANEKYAIVVPDGALDIIVEGASLCHCVGNSDRYWDRIERQESFILFLRKASAPTSLTTRWRLNRTALCVKNAPSMTVRRQTSRMRRSFSQNGSVSLPNGSMQMTGKRPLTAVSCESRNLNRCGRIIS